MAEDGEGILAALKAESIRGLYHFTSIDNLPSIRDAGSLCSKGTLEQLGLWPPARPGGNELSHSLDRGLGRWPYVGLTFTPRTPMAYHRKPVDHLCFLVVDPSVAAYPGVLFTDTNAASTSSSAQEGQEGLKLVNFAAVRSAPRPWDREGWVKPVQAEVLVPDRVPLDRVLRFAFVSQASRDEAARLWGPTSHPVFEVEQSVFQDSSTLNFPVLETLVLTPDAVEADTEKVAVRRASSFSRSGGPITLVASIVAQTGTVATVAWEPIQETHTEDFGSRGTYWFWLSVDASSFPIGRAAVTLSLRDVRWATVPFEVTR